MSKPSAVYTSPEIDHITKFLKPGQIANINPLLFKCRLSKADKANLSEEELLMRPMIQAKRAKFRYSQKHPEKYKANLDKLRNLGNKKEDKDNKEECSPKDSPKPAKQVKSKKRLVKT